MKIRLVAAELFHTDRHAEGSSRFSLLCERAQKRLRPAYSFLKMYKERFAITCMYSDYILITNLAH